MSLTLIMLLTAAAVFTIAFADTAMQWSLRLLLTEGSDYQRPKGTAEEVVVESDEEAQAAQAA